MAGAFTTRRAAFAGALVLTCGACSAPGVGLASHGEPEGPGRMMAVSAELEVVRSGDLACTFCERPVESALLLQNFVSFD